MQVRFHSSICYKIEGTENIRRCAGTWGGVWTKRGRLYLTVTATSEKTRRQQWWTPTMNRGSLAALFGEGAEGKGRGGHGLLMGVVREPFPLRINEGE
jgi:hypothetical protein